MARSQLWRPYVCREPATFCFRNCMDISMVITKNPFSELCISNFHHSSFAFECFINIFLPAKAITANIDIIKPI